MATLELSVDNLNNLKEALENQIHTMRYRDYDRVSLAKEIEEKERIKTFENILAGVDAAIIHAEME